MSEKGCARRARRRRICRKVMIACEQLTTEEIASRVHFSNLMSGEVIEVIQDNTAGRFPDAPTLGVIHVTSSGRGTGAERSIHLNESVFGVIIILVRTGTRTVAGQVSGSVVRVTVDAIVVLGVGRVVPRESGQESILTVLLPPVTKAIISKGKRAWRRGWDSNPR